MWAFQSFEQSFSVDGSVLATSRSDGAVMLFDASTGLLLNTIENGISGARNSNPSIASGPDWVTDTLKPLAFMMGHHPRLGAEAHILELDDELLRVIIKLV